MADVAVKPEIKFDPATSTPVDMADVEEFEDDHDLQIPARPTEGGPTAWLVKLPKYMWDAWSEIYRDVADETPIEIGKMRVYPLKDGEGSSKQKVQIRLNAGVPQHVELPKTYNLEIKATEYSNVVVFSEKDQPGQKNKVTGRRAYLSAGKGGGIRAKHERYGHLKPGRYRSAIPRQTALAPLIQHVADAAPVEDESYYAHFSKLYRAETAPKKTTTFQTGIDRRMQPGASNFPMFGITSRPKAKRPTRDKAVRMSQEALLDRIDQCFRRFKYWSLKALRNELKQPETYIKQTLESIATLVRSGDFAMNYVLRPEYADMKNIKDEDVKDETALVKSEAEGSDLGSGDEFDEDDEGDFEDVQMEGAG